MSIATQIARKFRPGQLKRHLVVLEHATLHQIFVEAEHEDDARAIARRVLATDGLTAFTVCDAASVEYTVYDPEALGIAPAHHTPLFSTLNLKGGDQ